MLDIGFSELLLIAVAALIFVGPKDLPVVVRHVAKFMHDLRGIYTGVRKQMHQLADEAGLNDLQRDMTTIIDLEGKPQQAYDVRELSSLGASAAARAVSLSPRERLGEGLPRAGANNIPPAQAQPSPNPLPQGEGFRAEAPPLPKADA